MNEVLFRKNVDQSLLNAGITIPNNVKERLLESLGVTLAKGDKEKISVIIEGVAFEATITRVDLSEKYSDRDVVQIRYAQSSPICLKLKSVFSRSAAILDSLKQKVGENESVKVPEKDREHLEVIALEPLKIEFLCYPKAPSGMLGSIFHRLLNEYAAAKQEKMAGHPIRAFIQNDIPALISKLGILDSTRYSVTARAGLGQWASVPWIGVFNREITTNATKGIYIAYLLSPDCTSIYLTLNQGSDELSKALHSKSKTVAALRKKSGRDCLIHCSEGISDRRRYSPWQQSDSVGRTVSGRHDFL